MLSPFGQSISVRNNSRTNPQLAGQCKLTFEREYNTMLDASQMLFGRNQIAKLSKGRLQRFSKIGKSTTPKQKAAGIASAVLFFYVAMIYSEQ